MGIPFVDPIQQLITQDVYGCLKKRCLILIHFKKNFIDLEEKKKELEKLRGKVEEQVEKAREQSEVIIKEVSEWMVDMEKTKKEVDVLLQEKTGRESIVCFRLGFPNYISRYRLSKRAEEKTVDVQKKIDGGNFSAVSGPAPPPPELQLPPTIGEYKVFESRAAVLNNIKDALKKNDVVGIHGAGGVGKTTMAAEVIKQLQSEGYIHEFAIAVVSQDPDVKRIQGKLASCLKNFQLDEMENKEERAKKLWNRLKNGKSNLVLLDDLWGKINLREIGIPVSVGNNECKLLITSRLPQEVWKDKSWESKLLVKQIRVKELNHQEAWALFKNHAGDSIETSEVHSIALEVCEKCGGLPVAISAVGRALCNKDLYGWKDALDKLKNYEMERIVDIDVELFRSLKLSYEMLSQEAQRCFLLCCLFPEDSEIPVEELVLHCQAAGFVGTVKVEETRNRVNTLISILKSRCLLLDVLDIWGDNKVKVHDVIRDIGIAISKEGNESLQLMHGFRGGGEAEGEPSSSSSSERKIKRKPYIAMWLRKSHFEDDHSFPGDVGTLVLDWYGSSIEDDHTLLLRANKFLCGKILSLKVLVLNGLNISSVVPSSSSGGESLPNLRMLWLDTWKADDAAVLRHLQKLKVFRLTDCDVVELPAEIGLLTELLVLDLKYLSGLRKIPSGVLSKLTLIEELHLPLNFTGWENGENESGRSENASISELSCLKRLTTLRAFFPNCDLPGVNDIFIGNLDRFYISVGSTWSDGTIVSTKGLKLYRVSITKKFNGLICKADLLWFDRVNGLRRSLLVTSHGFPHLKKLQIEGCHDLNYVFTEPCARALPELRKLTVWDCESLVSIVGGIEEEISEQDQGGDIIYFRRLEKLFLHNLPNLVGFHSWVKNRTSAAADGAIYIRGKIIYPCLKELVIIGCPDLNYVFTEPCARALPELRTLRVVGCESLVSIVGGIEEEISEQDQGGDIIYFGRLEELHLEDLPNLVGFHSWVKNRTSAAADGATYIRGKIVYPALKGCNFWAIHGFPCLKKLAISRCDDLNYVFTEPCARALPQLRELIVDYCERLVSIVGGIEEEISEQDQGGDIIYFGQLERLYLGYLPNLLGFHSWVKNRTSAAADGATYIRGKIVYPALKWCTFSGMPKATTEVFKSRILPQLTGQDSKEICQQENDFQGVSLPSLTFLGISNENIEMPEEISFTPAEHGITLRVNVNIEETGLDKTMFQPLFDSVLGFGCE